MKNIEQLEPLNLKDDFQTGMALQKMHDKINLISRAHNALQKEVEVLTDFMNKERELINIVIDNPKQSQLKCECHCHFENHTGIKCRCIKNCEHCKPQKEVDHSIGNKLIPVCIFCAISRHIQCEKKDCECYCRKDKPDQEE